MLVDDFEYDRYRTGGRRHALPPTGSSANTNSLFAHDGGFLVAAGAAAQSAADLDLTRRLNVSDHVEPHIKEILIIAHEKFLE
jgi:hypothetical protein